MCGTFADKEKKKAKTVEQTAATTNKKPGQVRKTKKVPVCIGIKNLIDACLTGEE